ncbi:SRPBCC domain-containing protein [Sphingomonas sp. MG17]|uniref:SRPBCC domain-containing protein n=1 Tax=Sphingomonas tagetis TaxID=2949092 RepID=A0A9X2HQ58_9SPHN|nr:SRPBCC domain-containing protein [Sphingomonas tagetis]MCP3730535.1 SRPBCC domain-containing protein [Sphingomonas tagetis]
MTRIAPGVDVAGRWIAASADAVYRALTDGAVVAQWLPPEGMTGEVAAFDARPGGCYDITLHYAEAGPGKTDAGSDHVRGRFVELVPGARVIQTGEFDSDDPAFAGTMRMTWTLTAEAGGTRVEVRAEGVPSGIGADDHDAGLRSSLNNLAAFLA